MGNCVTSQIKEYESYFSFETDLKKYFSNDGINVAIFVDRSQSNTQHSDRPLRANQNAPEVSYKSQFNQHWLPDDVGRVMSECKTVLNNPSLIGQCKHLNNYVKTMLLLALSTLSTVKCTQFYFFTFGGEAERAMQVTFWGRLTIMPAIQSYMNAVMEIEDYGRETSYQGIVDASLVLSSEMQVPLLSIIITDGVVSEHCRRATEEAIKESSRWPICFAIIICGKPVYQYLTDTRGKKFDNVTVVVFDEIFNVSSPWKEDVSLLLQLKLLSKIPQQFRIMTDKKIMYNLRKDRPVRRRDDHIIYPCRPTRIQPTQYLYPAPPEPGSAPPISQEEWRQSFGSSSRRDSASVGGIAA